MISVQGGNGVTLRGSSLATTGAGENRRRRHSEWT